MGVRPILVWVPAHANIPLNEMADKSANEAAKEAKNESSLEAMPLSKATAFKIINDIVKKEWQRQWQTTTSGLQTRELVREVSSKLPLPKKRTIAISYIRALLNDTLLNDTMHRQGLAPSCICDCGQERETLDHFVCRCPNYTAQREILYRTYQQIIRESQHRLSAPAFLQSFIGHRWNEELSVQDEIKVKEAFFTFLQQTARSL